MHLHTYFRFLTSYIPALVAIMIVSTGACVAQRFEAENGTLSGTEVSRQLSGYSGTGYVTGFDGDGDKATLTINVPSGVYNLYISYASPFGEKFNYVFVNGDNAGSVAFPLASSFVETKVGKVFLGEGPNTISIVKDWGYFHMDNIRLEASAHSPINHVTAELATRTPSAKADSLYGLLKKTYGKAIWSGQYGGETEFNHIANVSGKTPVIRGFDMMDYSPSRVERGTVSTETEKAIDWNGERGITTFCWHWNAPKDLIDEPGKEWWRGFYTEATTFDVSKAMHDQTSEEFTLILRDIDAIAVQLKRLQDANVPVLWRPLHEAEGKWFWWGAKGPEACVWLWRLLFERLVHHHGLNNLIWVWTSTASVDALSWYPGDEYVDFIGADIYLAPASYGSNFITFDNLASLFGGRKIIALSENGPIPHPENLFREGVAWSWFATWSGHFITDGTVNTASHIENVYTHDYVITLDEIDRIDEIITYLQEKKESESPPVTAVEEGTELQFQNPLVASRLVLTHTPYPARICVYDLQGKKVFQDVNTTPQGHVEFNFEHKPAGMYLLKVISGKEVRIYRIVKTDKG